MCLDVLCMCVCRWLHRPSSFTYAQDAVHCSACDNHRCSSFRYPTILSSFQQSPAIPKRFSATSFINIRWHCSSSAYATHSQNVLTCSDVNSFQESRKFFPNTVPILRSLHTTNVGRREPESKVEETLEALKDSVKKVPATEQSDSVVAETKILPEVTKVTDVTPPAVPDVVTPPKKKSLWVRFKAEMVHYYHGFRLLFIDIRVALRLIWQVLNGRTLIRRERKQVGFMITKLLANILKFFCNLVTFKW